MNTDAFNRGFFEKMAANLERYLQALKEGPESLYKLIASTWVNTLRARMRRTKLPVPMSSSSIRPWVSAAEPADVSLARLSRLLGEEASNLMIRFGRTGLPRLAEKPPTYKASGVSKNLIRALKRGVKFLR